MRHRLATPAIDRRLSSFELRTSYCLATILDPRFKLRWCTTDATRQIQRNVLLTKLKKTSNPAEKDAVVQSENLPGTGSPPKKKKKTTQLWSFMENPSTSALEVPTSKAEHEVENYLNSAAVSEDCNPLEYWKVNQLSYPMLLSLAKKYSSVPASSAPVERIFSIGGNIFRPARCCLSDNLFQELMFIKLNRLFTEK